MIVCDSHVAFLALAGGVQFTPETLVTTAYEQLTIVLGLQRDRGPGIEGVFKTYLKELGMIDLAEMIALASDPDPSVLMVADVSPHVALASELAVRHGVSPLRSLLLAVAKEMGACLCIGEKDNPSLRDAAIAEGVPFQQLENIALRDGAHERDNPRHDRRRPGRFVQAS